MLSLWQVFHPGSLCYITFVIAGGIFGELPSVVFISEGRCQSVCLLAGVLLDF